MVWVRRSGEVLKEGDDGGDKVKVVANELI